MSFIVSAIGLQVENTILRIMSYDTFRIPCVRTIDSSITVNIIHVRTLVYLSLISTLTIRNT